MTTKLNEEGLEAACKAQWNYNPVDTDTWEDVVAYAGEENKDIIAEHRVGMQAAIQAYLPFHKPAEWLPWETVKPELYQVIAWLSSDQGFQDTTAVLYYSEGNWYWNEDFEYQSIVKRPDLIKGWQHFPLPPQRVSQGGDDGN